MNYELSPFEKTVLRHARKVNGDFEKIYFITSYLDNERAIELFGMGKQAAQRWLEFIRSGGVLNNYHLSRPSIIKAQKFCETYFPKKETGNRLEANSPHRIKCRA